MLQGPVRSLRKKKSETIDCCGDCEEKIRKEFLEKLLNKGKNWNQDHWLRCPRCGYLYVYFCEENRFSPAPFDSLLGKKKPWPYKLPLREQPEFLYER